MTAVSVVVVWRETALGELQRKRLPPIRADLFSQACAFTETNVLLTISRKDSTLVVWKFSLVDKVTRGGRRDPDGFVNQYLCVVAVKFLIDKWIESFGFHSHQANWPGPVAHELAIELGGF